MPETSYKVAHMLPWPAIGGTELATLRVARAVGEEGFRSVAFCTGEGAVVREMFAGAGFETATYDPVPPSYRRPKNFLRNSHLLAREFRRRGVSLVHCSDLPAGFHAALAGRLAGLPVLCHVRGRVASLSRRDRSLLAPVSKFAFVSRDAWEHFGHKVPARRGVVIYDGLDAFEPADGGEESRGVRREFAIPEAAKIVGMVARVAPVKDFATLARAAGRVLAREPRVRFLIVGDYEQSEAHRAHYAEVRQLLEASGVAPYFVFTGFREDVTRLVGALDVCVLSTHLEGLPLVILEAMARGVPVAATAVGGIPEIVRHDETGLLHEHEDDDALAENLLSLLGDGERAARLAAAARRFVRQSFNREQFKRALSGVYRELLGGRRARSQATADGRAGVEVVGRAGGN